MAVLWMKGRGVGVGGGGGVGEIGTRERSGPAPKRPLDSFRRPRGLYGLPGERLPQGLHLPPNNQPSPDAKLYHRDGFLHFWAPYDSPYNLNPFARFVHNDAGLAALGAYSFSIDDFYGNFAGPGSTLIIDVGGTTHLPNKDAFNPYEQYFASWGMGWNQATVCGRDVTIPDKTVGQSFPISFWRDGVKSQPPICEVALYADANRTKFVKFHVEECSYSVTDTYSGQPHTVRGLCGKEFGPIFAARPGNTTPTPNDRYCSSPALSHSTQALIDAGACHANLSPAGGTLLYAGVTECNDPQDDTCGRPLMTLNIPPCPAGQCDP